MKRSIVDIINHVEDGGIVRDISTQIQYDDMVLFLEDCSSKLVHNTDDFELLNKRKNIYRYFVRMPKDGEVRFTSWTSLSFSDYIKKYHYFKDSELLFHQGDKVVYGF